jgi:hypothetical protein
LILIANLRTAKKGKPQVMKSSKGAVVSRKKIRSRARPLAGNRIYFPQALRDAIPGPELPGCARCLNLSSIGGDYSDDKLFGQSIRLKFLAEESGKLKGTFEIGVELQLDAARGLVATLRELVGRIEKAGV